jgi:hypothetical protein
MEHDVDRVTLAVDRHPRRIHEERHVVVDDLDHGVSRLPAVLVEERVVNPDLGRPGRPLPGEAPVGYGRSVDVDWRAVGQVLQGDPGVVLAHEFLDLRCLILGQLLPNAINDLVEKLILNQHRYAPPVRFPFLG